MSCPKKEQIKMKKKLQRLILSYISLFSIILNMLSPLAYGIFVTTPVRAQETVEAETLRIDVLPDTSATSVSNADLVISDNGGVTLRTDKTDYAPTDTALITGAGYTPNDSYLLIIWSDDEPAVRTTINITADASGHITYAYQLDGNYRPDYQVEVRNQAGEVVSSVQFSDSRWVVSAKVNGSSSTTVNPTATISTEVQVMTWNGVIEWNNDWRSTSYRFNSNPPICVNTSNHNNTGIHTESFSITAPVNPGTYDITFQAYSNDSCSAGMISIPLTLNNAITVRDIIPPVITMLGSSPVFVEFGASYSDFGATAFDNVDGNLTASIVTSSTVNPNKIGIYNVTYNVTDTAGNAATTVTRVVKVVDTTTPTTPIITSPIEGQVFPTSPILNSWLASFDLSGIKEYHVEYIYDDGHTFPGGPIRVVTTTSRNHSPSPTEQGGVTIRVRAVDNVDNVGAWSSPVHYYYDATKPASPGIPTTTSYLTNSLIQNWIWAPANDGVNGSGIKGYWQNIYDVITETTQSQVWLGNILGSSTNLADGNWQLQLQAEDNAGNKSSVVSSSTITVDTVAPAAPILASPANNAAVNGASLTNSWGSVGDAHHYIYESYHNEEATNIHWTQTVNAPETSKTRTNVPETTFWWRVKAVDAAGNVSEWSPLWKLTIDNTTPVVTLTETPANGLLTNINNQVFGVTTSEPTSLCTLNFDNESTYPMSMVEDDNTSWTVTVLDMIDGTYHYSVTCVDFANNTGESLSRSMTIDTKAPVLGDKTVFLGWYNTNQTSFFTYQDENGIGEETTNPISCVISTEGENQTCSIPEVNICDRAGNCNTEGVTSNKANIDKVAPVIKLSTSPTTPDGKNNWFLTRPALTLSVIDVNPDISEFKWGEFGVWTNYTGTFTPPAEGKYDLFYRALDKSGKYSEVGYSEIKWDQTGLTKAPFELSVSPNPTTLDKSTVSWKAAEDLMGISKYEVEWRLGDTVYKDTVGGSTLSYEVNRLTEGDWKITVRAFDDAGHSLEANIGLKVDRTAPTSPNLAITGIAPGSVSLSWNAIETATAYSLWYGTVSGVYTFGAKVGNVTNFTVTGLGVGSYYFIVKAHDEAGNVSSASNEVSTGAMTGALGVEPGAPAEGFAPAEEVLGEQT